MACHREQPPRKVLRAHGKGSQGAPDRNRQLGPTDRRHQPHPRGITMGLFRSISDGFKALRDKRARNDEIAEELESFLGESINEKMRRGISPEDAIRAARAEIGSSAVIQHKVWHAGWEST